MTHIEQFIKDVVAGGHPISQCQKVTVISLGKTLRMISPNGFNETTRPVAEILLDKDAWIAVGKTRGWTELYKEDSWLGYWHDFIDHLADGKSIEEALAAIK